MKWSTSAVNGAKLFRNGVTWIINNTPIVGLIRYTANTMFYVTEQILALREAIPAMIAPFKARAGETSSAVEPVQKIIEGMGHVVFYDVLPVLAINCANNYIQSRSREHFNETQGLPEVSHTLFLSLLSLVNYGVQFYNYRQASKLIVHSLVLDTIAPSIFTAHKTLQSQATLCIEEECNFKRKFKGSLRGTIGLAVNDLVLWGIGQFTYGGREAAWILGIYFYGEHITYMATPERCERHKAMGSESVLSLGLTYSGSLALINYALESTIATPPYPYNRVLQHLLLLLHIHVASYMSLPLVKLQKNGVIPIYDGTKRFLIDAILNALIKIDFKPPKGTEPFIPLSLTLRFLTQALNSDLEKIQSTQPGFFKKATRMVLPNMFHNSKNAVNDPVIKRFWPEIRSDLLHLIEIVESAKAIQTLTTGVKPISSTVKYTLPKLLRYYVGLPVKLSEFLLFLSKKDYFWDFVTALKGWIERNDIAREIILMKTHSKTGLYEADNLIKSPLQITKTLVSSPVGALKPSETPVLHDIERLIPVRNSVSPVSSVSAASLFPTRNRKNLARTRDERAASFTSYSLFTNT